MSLEQFTDRFRRDFGHLLGGRVVVALSGGADSVALLHLLRDPSLHIDLLAAHVHHSARGDEADRDAAFCNRLCSRLGLPFHQLTIAAGPAPSAGREAEWRQLRYRALEALASEVRAAAVATGHHRDDVAEGVLLQLLRGAGPRALAGIKAETSHAIIRPLLSWRREEIRRWLAEQRIDWVEDSSNADPGHLRNRVRHSVLPGLRSVEPRIDDHLVHLAGLLSQDEAHFAAELAALGAWIRPWHPDGGVCWEAIRDLPSAIRSRWLHAQAARCALGPVTRRQTELFHRLVETGSPRAVTLAGRWVLRLAARKLWLVPPELPGPFQLELEPGTEAPLPFPGWRIRVASESDRSSATATWRWRVSSNAALTVRTPVPGDLIVDGESSIKVAKLLARTVPRHLRSGWPVLCENARITWIPGVWQGACTGDLPAEVEIDG